MGNEFAVQVVNGSARLMPEYYQLMMDYMLQSQSRVNTIDFIFFLIQAIIFAIPLLIVIYNQGRKDQILKKAVEDVDNIGKKVGEINDKHSQTLSELKTEMGSIKTALAEVTTSMKFIKEAVERLDKQ